MVKNKKMSKTSIAVIVLAVLLVLSLVMGLTGAWFTAKANQQALGGKGTTITMNDFISLAFSGNNADDIKVVIDGEERAPEAIEYVMPGDQFKVKAGTEYALTVTRAQHQDCDFYYVILQDNNAINVSGSDRGVKLWDHTASDNEVLWSYTTTDATADYSDLADRAVVGGYNVYTIKTTLQAVEGVMGETINVAIAGFAGLEVRAIQKNNISLQEAQYMLLDAWSNGNPAKAANNG